MNKYSAGNYVKVGPWCGVVIDVLTSPRQTVLEIDFVKNAQRGRKSEFISLSGRLNITLVGADELRQEFVELIKMQHVFFDKLIGDDGEIADDTTDRKFETSALRCDKPR